MKRWHALYFALAVMIGAESLVGDREHDGILERTRTGYAQSADAAEAGQQSASGSVSADERSGHSVVAHSSSDPWAADKGAWGTVAIDVMDGGANALHADESDDDEAEADASERGDGEAEPHLAKAGNRSAADAPPAPPVPLFTGGAPVAHAEGVVE